MSTVRPRRYPWRFGRLFLALAAAAGVLLLVAARLLEPDPRGYGTHEQLGLTPCYFQSVTGHVCPMCGCTTAWSYTMRGQFTRAAAANLGGTLLCLAVVIGSPWMLLTTILGRWPLIQPRWSAILVTGSAWLVVVVLDWLRRIYVGL